MDARETGCDYMDVVQVAQSLCVLTSLINF
jgi:hypothetical protein